MIKIKKIQIKGVKNKSNDLIVLIDDKAYEEYLTLNNQLLIQAQFNQSYVESIQLNITPPPEFDVVYKLFSLNEEQKEINVEQGQLLQDRLDDRFAVYKSIRHKYMQFTHLQISIKSEKILRFRIYYVGLKKKMILDQEEIIRQQQKEEQSQKIKNAMLAQPPQKISSKSQNQCLNTISFREFLNKVKTGQSVNSLFPEEKLTKKDSIIEEKQLKQITEQQKISIQEQNEISEQKQEIEIISQQTKFGINENTRFEQIFKNWNKRYQDPDQNIIIKTKTQNDEENDWLEFDISDIDQQFVQVHEELEIAKGLASRLRLTERMNKKE